VHAVAGDISVAAGGSITAAGVSSTDGSVHLNAAGDVLIGEIAATQTVSLTATEGAIRMSHSGSVGIEALSTTLNAGTTLGAQDRPLRTAVDALNASADSDIHILESDGLSRAGAASTSGHVKLSAYDDLTVAGGDGGGVTAGQSTTLHAGIDGTGDLAFEAGARLASPTIRLRAGDGPDGASAATVDFAGMHVASGNRSLTIQQDGSIDGAPDHARLAGGVAHVDLTLQSDDKDIRSNTAHGWKSITAAAHGDIAFQGPGTINTGTLLEAKKTDIQFRSRRVRNKARTPPIITMVLPQSSKNTLRGIVR